jgi:hypothetical protein
MKVENKVCWFGQPTRSAAAVAQTTDRASFSRNSVKYEYNQNFQVKVDEMSRATGGRARRRLTSRKTKRGWMDNKKKLDL